jgi:hypothetical protein
MDTEITTNKFKRYYDKNKDAILARRKARREAMKAKGEKLPRKSRAKIIDESKLERYNQLFAEMESLKKDASILKRRKTLKEEKNVLKEISKHDKHNIIVET